MLNLLFTFSRFVYLGDEEDEQHLERRRPFVEGIRRERVLPRDGSNMRSMGNRWGCSNERQTKLRPKSKTILLWASGRIGSNIAAPFKPVVPPPLSGLYHQRFNMLCTVSSNTVSSFRPSSWCLATCPTTITLLVSDSLSSQARNNVQEPMLASGTYWRTENAIIFFHEGEGTMTRVHLEPDVTRN